VPIYEFKCGSCGHEKEILITKQSDLKGSSKLGCDKCKGMYTRLMSVTSDPVVHGFNERNGYSNAGKGKKDGKKIRD
jgi:putative FmdB family regulatory protein